MRCVSTCIIIFGVPNDDLACIATHVLFNLNYNFRPLDGRKNTETQEN